MEENWDDNGASGTTPQPPQNSNQNQPPQSQPPRKSLNPTAAAAKENTNKNTNTSDNYRHDTRDNYNITRDTYDTNRTDNYRNDEYKSNNARDDRQYPSRSEDNRRGGFNFRARSDYSRNDSRDNYHRNDSAQNQRDNFSNNYNRNDRGGNAQNHYGHYKSYNENEPGEISRENRGRGDYNGRTERPPRNNDNYNQQKSGDAQNLDAELLGADRPPQYNPEMPSEDPSVIFQPHITEGINFNKYNDIVVKVSGGNEKQDMINTFEECHFFEQLTLNIKKSNYRTPTPIQKFTIPIILNDEYDLMGCAQTGSGKTAAYLIPTFSNLLKNNLIDLNSQIPEPYILVISPTRELTNQICLEMKKFAYGTGIKTAMVYGGITSSFISKNIRSGCHSLAATPGRLLDILNRGWISLEKVKYLILDEADRMLDMGFIGDIRKIVFYYGMPGPDKRRCLMFSATFPQEVRELAREILAPGYYFITVGIVGSAAESIVQEFHQLAPFEKRNKLMEILEEHKGSRILVFVDTKRSADFLTTFICQKGLKATSIHGDRFQEQREEALKMFRSGETTILVATSVAARGLDIKDVQIVVNFDLPSEIDEYIHRIGRTGRLGNKGLSISFFTADKDERLSSHLVQNLRNAGQKIPQFLENYDYDPVKLSNRNSRDDREITSRTHHVNPSNSNRQEEKRTTAPYVEAVEEQWD